MVNTDEVDCSALLYCFDRRVETQFQQPPSHPLEAFPLRHVSRNSRSESGVKAPGQLEGSLWRIRTHTTCAGESFCDTPDDGRIDDQHDTRGWTMPPGWPL